MGMKKTILKTIGTGLVASLIACGSDSPTGPSTPDDSEFRKQIETMCNNSERWYSKCGYISTINGATITGEKYNKKTCMETSLKAFSGRTDLDIIICKQNQQIETGCTDFTKKNEKECER